MGNRASRLVHSLLLGRQDARRPHSQDGCATMSQPRNATLSTPKAFASHYRLNAINFRSLRRCVKPSPAIASAPPIHVLGSGTGAAPVTVRIMSLPITDRENGTVVARHGASLRELACGTTVMVKDNERLPHGQRGTDVN